MKELFVNHIQALALKEIGFQEPCIARFIGSQFSTNTLANWYNHNGGEISNKMISAPLKSQAFGFFMKEYGYWSYIKESRKGMSMFYIEKFDEKFFNSHEYESYKQAESECIDKLIKIVTWKRD